MRHAASSVRMPYIGRNSRSQRKPLFDARAHNDPNASTISLNEIAPSGNAPQTLNDSTPSASAIPKNSSSVKDNAWYGNTCSGRSGFQFATQRIKGSRWKRRTPISDAIDSRSWLLNPWVNHWV